MTSIGTARHFQPHGTPGHVCRDHNRAVLAPAVAVEALRQGLGPDLTDAQLDQCAVIAERNPLSDTSRAAVRTALEPALSVRNSPATVHHQLFNLPPGHPLRVRVGDTEYFLVPIPITL
ncbi:hypothetical protein AB0N20_02135 [Streptomyces griseoincarnatus]|uniref:Uncharacterized protein n=2 Tax=Streptomyces TaxID=1883 RepID=A0A0M9XB55_9ACTN|nr:MULTISPECIES: hypothetical protein [Streptomyces]KOT46793.1 hypothetical protein ADK41_01010 [Streptomyces caelestis]